MEKLLVRISMAAIILVFMVFLSVNGFAQRGGGSGGGGGGGGPMYKYDTDGNGEISLKEFEDLEGDPDRWPRWDANGDGVVDADESAAIAGRNSDGGGSSGGRGGH